MQPKFKRWIRWVVIGLFGYLGVDGLVNEILYLVLRRDVQWTFSRVMIDLMMTGTWGVFLAVAWFVYKRQYRRLCPLLPGFGAGQLFACIVAGLDWMGLWEKLHAGNFEESLFDGLVSVGWLVAGWYLARWVYRRGQVFLRERILHEVK